MEEYSEVKPHRSEPEPGNENVNTVYFVNQAREILDSVARSLSTMNEHAIANVMAYINVVWSSCDKHCLNRVLKPQKWAVRIILDADSQASSVKLFHELKRIPFYELAKIAKCCIICKRLQGHVPTSPKSSLKLSVRLTRGKPDMQILFKLVPLSNFKKK